MWQPSIALHFLVSSQKKIPDLDTDSTLLANQPSHHARDPPVDTNEAINFRTVSHENIRTAQINTRVDQNRKHLTNLSRKRGPTPFFQPRSHSMQDHPWVIGMSTLLPEQAPT